MTIDVFFKEVGGDFETVSSRLPSKEMLIKFLLKFPNDPSFDSLCDAWEAGDAKSAFLAAHTLKGTAATLGLDALADAATQLTELLRNVDALPAEEYFTSVKTAYENTILKISQLDR